MLELSSEKNSLTTSSKLLTSKEISPRRLQSTKPPHSDKVSAPTNIYMKDILRKVAEDTSLDRDADTSVNNHLLCSTMDNTSWPHLAANSPADKPTLLALNSNPTTIYMKDTLRKVADVTNLDRDADTLVNNHPLCSTTVNTFSLPTINKTTPPVFLLPLDYHLDTLPAQALTLPDNKSSVETNTLQVNHWALLP